MHISWLGTTAIKLQTKPADQEIMIILDPYRPEHGDFPRSLTPTIALYTRGEDNSITLSGSPFILATSGECETHGVLMSAIHGDDDQHHIFRIDTEHLSLGHLGLARHELTDDQLDLVGGVDILFVPVGGDVAYDAEQAAKIVNVIEPRVVIPMAFQSDNDPKLAKVDLFLKEMGVTNGGSEKKIILKKKDLPQEETNVMVLAKE